VLWFMVHYFKRKRRGKMNLLLLITLFLAALISPGARGASASARCSAESMKRGGALATTQSTPLRSFVSSIIDARRHLAAAAVARSVSIFGMYPIDTMKVRFGLAYIRKHTNS
jgi:hypothetical protein